MAARLKETYKERSRSCINEKFEYKSVMQIPKPRQDCY